MDQLIEQATSKVITHLDLFFRNSPPDHSRYLIGITGRPGSGKTTIANTLCQSINSHYRHQPNLLVRSTETKEGLGIQSRDSITVADVDPIDPSMNREISIVISLDGWHYPRSVLDRFEDPVEAHRRRGSPKTFDSRGYLNFLRSLLKSTDGSSLIRAPSFSHSLKDPIPDSISISPHQRIIILEGLYTLLEDSPDWKSASSLIHLPVLIEIDPDRSKRRLINRHVLSGICQDADQASQRVDFNDHPNGEYLLSHSRKPEIIIESIEDPLIQQRGMNSSS